MSAGVAAGAPPAEVGSIAALARAKARRRRRLVRAAQAGTVVVLLGNWEMLSRLGVIDPRAGAVGGVEDPTVLARRQHDVLAAFHHRLIGHGRPHCRRCGC